MKNLFHTSRLSYGQQALWYLNQLEPNSTAYHLGICLELNGSLNEHALASTWTDIGMAHPQLRARFTLHDEGPSITIDSFPVPLRVEKNGIENLDLFWEEIAKRPFDLENEAPVRALLLRSSNTLSHLLLCSHHIVSDLWSSAIVLRELSTGYKTHIPGHGAPVISCEKMDYAEFTDEERLWQDGPEGRASWNFWRKYFDGMKMKPILTRCVGNGASGEVPIILGDTTARFIRQTAREKATTPYAVLLACYARLLGEEISRDELIIGTPATIRTRAALRSTVGYLVNAVPVRCPVGTGGENTISAVATNALIALNQRRFPFSALVERFGIPRMPGTTPIFQSMFAYQSLPRMDRGFLSLALSGGGAQWEFGGGITAKKVAMPAFDAQFPIALTLGPDGEGFFGSLQYDGRRVTARNATRLAERFPNLVREFLTIRKPKLHKVVLGDQVERLEHLFDQTVRQMPESIAVCDGGVNLSYADVKAKAEEIAIGLDAALLGCERPVALQMPSCAEASIIILAILKSGRAFQPIDPSEPNVRRNAALLRTGACALISPLGIDPGILPEGTMALNPGTLKMSFPSAIRIQTPSRTAYLVYTSGSTGEPKAVEVEHAAVINHARATARIFGLRPSDRVLQFHTLAFDAAFEEIFPSWIAGACVAFEPQARTLNIPDFLEMVKRNDVTVLNFPTSYWHTLTVEAVRLNLHPASSVRLLIVGGEQASTRIYSAWRKLAPNCRWINTYGPTEATITSLSYEPSPGTSIRGIIPIGRPIDGVTTLLLNEAGKPITIGEGELLIGGKGLALGYRGDTETTAAKFVTHINGEMQRFYRTGDRVRLRRDGNFEYLGRLDRQVKIRGYRVDPDEIEQALRSHPSVIDAVVMPQEVKGELILMGWITRADVSLTERQLRDHLFRHLPAHMIPSRLAFVARMPRKTSGKLDMSALNRTRQQRMSRNGRGPLEMADLFSELLGHKVGLQDDFFLSGGHSLLAIKLLGQVETQFGVRISISDFVATPTAKGLWTRLHAAPSSDSAITEEPVLFETSISAQQKRALLAHEIGLPSLANIVLLLSINGQFDKDAFRCAIETVAQQNFLLRSGFFRTDAGIVLRKTKLSKLEHRTLSGRDFKKNIVNLAEQEGSKPFILDESAPWIRLLLASAQGTRNHYLILITHHAVADGWALELLLNDLRASYNHAHRENGRSAEPTRDYRFYALQQARWLKSDTARKQISFWKKRLSGAQEPRPPFRQPTSRNTSWQIERSEMTLPLRLSRDFRQVAASYGITPFALAMACFKTLIHRYAGQNDITLGTVVSNRSAHADQNIFGPLQNPVLIRDEITSNLSIRAFAQRVAFSLAEAQDNGALPFEHVIREALPQRSAAREGGIQFLSHDFDAHTLRMGPAFLHPIEIPVKESPFELSVAVSAAAPHIKIVFEYQPTAYAAPGIKCLTRQFATLLQSVVDTPNATVGELNMIPAEEFRALHRRISRKYLPHVELLHEGFESQVIKNPNAQAVIARDRCLTYGELNSMSETTAQTLVEHGLKERGLVAVMLPKGWEQIVACLAILKAGGVYVPLDSALPMDRLKTIVEQGKFHAAIVGDAGLADAPWARGLHSVLTIHSQARRVPKSRWIRTKPDSLAYIIFTSGSTGVPKGVMISHQAAMTTIAEINRRFQIQPNDRVFAVSSLGFDLSVFDIFGTLRAGGTIVIPSSQDPKEWIRQAVTEKITAWNSVPCLFELLLDEAAQRRPYLETLRLVMLSGDFISLSLARRIRKALPWSRLISLGGATEGAIWSIAREIDEIDPSWHRIPYGRALRQQEMFVLDGSLNHCPAGVTGELFIAGAGLAKGYWHNRTETKRRFLHHPQWKIRLYRTGDEGRYLESGEIEILGRLDKQVKVNGVRIELGEVEAALCSLPSVRQALVEVRADASGNKKIVAFVDAESGMNSATLITHAKRILPAALMPSAYVVLDRLPLASNGKVDRAALSAMNLSASTNAVALPENPAELWIANLWSTLLGGISVGVEDDFFSLGGHSLLAIKMLQRVRQHFAADLPLSLVVEHPTVRGLALAVKTATLTPITGLSQRATSEFERDSEPVISKLIRRVDQKSNAVLLTGATGRLGSALLIELLKRTDDPIYCLVRSSSKQEAEMRILKVLQSHNIETVLLQRIVAIPADLGRERFGLEPSIFVNLAMDVRAIYHCAAEVNFVASYEKLAASNVGGVREMIRLATASGAVLHHVSSVAVFPYGSSKVCREDEDISRIQRLTGGYAQTKWTSELMVWKAIVRGLRAVIYRPAQIVGRTAGLPHDLFDHTLHVCKTLRAVPDIEAKIDLVTSEYAAAAIYALSISESSLGKAFHLVHPEPISLRDFVRLFPAPLPLVPLDSWLSFLNQEARRCDDASLHFVSMLAQGLGRTELTPPCFDCSGTTTGLHGTGIICPSLDRQFIRRELAFSEEVL